MKPGTDQLLTTLNCLTEKLLEAINSMDDRQIDEIYRLLDRNEDVEGLLRDLGVDSSSDTSNASMPAFVQAAPPAPAIDGANAGMSESSWANLLVGVGPAMQSVARVIRLVSTRRCNVLLTGETGTGKSLAARVIHLASNRASLPFVSVNCAALPESLLEVELFGFAPAAFRASGGGPGAFEMADRGTVFLDEIDEMPLVLQRKLMQVLQDREVSRLGCSEKIKVDFRLLAATKQDLPDRIQSGQFLEPLYYRLNAVPIRMPSLRERREDIPQLTEHFLAKNCAGAGSSRKELSDEAATRLTQQPWPGNVQQLESAIEMAVALSGDRKVLASADFRFTHGAPRRATTIAIPGAEIPRAGLNFDQTVAEFERAVIAEALRMTGGDKKQAAEILRLKRSTLSAKLRSFEALAVAKTGR